MNYKNILSYSLYGDNRKYFNALCKNIDFIDLFYKNTFTIMIVVESDIPSSWLKFLYKSSAVVVMSDDHYLKNIPKDFYRIYPIVSGQGDACFFRDADSHLTKYEMDSMTRFIDSNFMYHIVRDHPNHLAPIMGGLFGIKSIKYETFKDAFFSNISKYKFANKSWRNEKSGARGDQTILADHIYPLAYKEALIESNFVLFWNERLLVSECKIPKIKSSFMGQIDPEFNPDNERDIRDYKLGVKKFYLPYRMFKFFRYRYLYRLYWSVKN
jgi:hypothetical protein